jgi:nucleoside-diphosphate-sugar epimerase
MAPLQPGDKVVVTGAGGFVGGALTRRLAASGLDVVAASRRALPQAPGIREVRLANYDRGPALAGAFAGARAVVHLAAHAHRPGTAEDFAQSVDAARAVAHAAVEADVPRLILVSSIGVNGNTTPGGAFDESSTPHPVEAYALSKLQAERVVVAATEGTATAHVILRPPLVVGPGAPGNVARLVRAVARGVPLPFASVRNARSFVALDNLLDVISVCIDHPAAADQLFLVADGEALSTPEVVREIAAGLGVQPRLFAVPPTLLRAAAALAGRSRLAESLCDSLVVDAGKARRMLAWQPRLGAAEGIRLAAGGSTAS